MILACGKVLPAPVPVNHDAICVEPNVEEIIGVNKLAALVQHIEERSYVPEEFDDMKEGLQYLGGFLARCWPDSWEVDDL